MVAAAKDSLTVRCGLCEELLEGTAEYPHFIVPPSACLGSVRKTEHQSPWKFRERILWEKDSDSRTVLHGPQGHNLHSQALLWLKKLGVSDPARRIYLASAEHPPCSRQSTSQPMARANSSEQRSNMKCHLPVEKVLGPYQKCQVHYLSRLLQPGLATEAQKNHQPQYLPAHLPLHYTEQSRCCSDSASLCWLILI